MNEYSENLVTSTFITVTERVCAGKNAQKQKYVLYLKKRSDKNI